MFLSKILPSKIVLMKYKRYKDSNKTYYNMRQSMPGSMYFRIISKLNKKHDKTIESNAKGMLAITTAGVELYLTSAWSCVILINITRLWYKSILMLLFFLFTQLKVVNLFFQQCSIYRHTLRTKWIVFLLHHLGRTVQHVENKASFWLLFNMTTAY